MGAPLDAPKSAATRAADAVRPARVEVIGFTPGELAEARRRGNPLVVELDTVGVPLV